MIYPSCPHCRVHLGSFAYAHACPHCHQELVRNRRGVSHSELRPASAIFFGVTGAAIGAATALIWNLSVPSVGGVVMPTLIGGIAVGFGAVLGVVFARQVPQRRINQRRRLDAFYGGFDEVPGSGATARRARGVVGA